MYLLQKVFINEKDFKILQNEHTLPISHSNDSLTNKSNSAFKNMFKTVQLEGDGSIDLIKFMLQKQHSTNSVRKGTKLTAESTTFG